jgi:hypothetical protein
MTPGVSKSLTRSDARNVALAVGKIGDEKGIATHRGLKAIHPDQWTFLPAHEFSVQDVALRAGMDETLVARVLTAFAVPDGERNADFTALNEFNVASA